MTAAVAVDVGSTNVKAVLIGPDGDLVDRSARPLTTERAGDTAVQDPDAMWDAVVDAVSTLTRAEPAVAEEVTVFGVASQYSSLVPVAADGAPVGPVIMYMDQHGTDHSFAIFDRHPDAMEVWVERHGLPPLGGGLSLAHFLHLQHDRPDVHAAAAHHVEPMDYVTARLTGRVTATQASMFMMQVCDNRDLADPTYDDELVAMAGVDRDRLPPLVDPTAPVGALTSAAAAHLGLPGDVVVYPGLNDTQVGAVATGALDPDRSGLSVGTTSVVIDTMPAPAADLDRALSVMPGPMGDDYVLWAENGLGGRAVEHVVVELLAGSFDDFDDIVAGVEARRDAPLFLPWLDGSMAPSLDGGMRGGFVNLAVTHAREDLVWAAVEGVAHNVAWVTEAAEDFMGRPVDRLVANGGAARSPAVVRLLADVTGRPVAALRDPEVGVARAAGLLALHRTGALDRAGLSAAVVTAEPQTPDPARVDVHHTRHEQFLAAFEATRPICRSLSP